MMPVIDIEFPMLPRLPALLCKFLWMLVVFDIRYSEISCDVIAHVVMTVPNHLTLLLRKCVIKCRLMEICMHDVVFIANQHWFC